MINSIIDKIEEMLPIENINVVKLSDSSIFITCYCEITKDFKQLLNLHNSIDILFDELGLLLPQVTIEEIVKDYYRYIFHIDSHKGYELFIYTDVDVYVVK